MADNLPKSVKDAKRHQKAFLRYKFTDVNFSSITDVYTSVKGRMFGEWIDLIGRTNSYSANDLIENPVGIIESVIRDMVLTEHNLVVSDFDIAQDTITFGGSANFLSNSTNDYYNNAYIVNIDKDWTKKITDYSGTAKECTVSTLISGDVAVGDRCYITNIQGDNLIDYASFDTAMSARSDWKFAFSLDSQIEGYSLLDQLCYESQCVLYKNYDKYYIKAIGTGTTVGTLSNPLKERNGNKMVDVTLSDIQDVYSEFVVNYAFLPQENTYAKSLFCNKSNSNNVLLTPTYKNLCSGVETNYRVHRKLEMNLDFVYDETTAVYFLQRIIKEKTIQRLIIGYIGNLSDHIQYEKGDLVKINISDRIPSSKNNSTQFLITKQDIPFKRGMTEISIKLIEMIA